MKTFYALFALPFLLLVTSCDDKDYYDPDSQKIPDELSDLTVPSGFDWATSSQIALTFDVDNQDNNSYHKIEVFDKNPIISSDANLLAEGLTKKNDPFKATVTYSTADSTLYVQQTSPSGQRSVKAIYVSNNVKSANVSSLKSTTVDSSNKRTKVNITYTEPKRVYTTPANATLISGNSKVYTRTPNASYVIPAGQTFEGEIINDYYYKVYIYVEGTWKNPATETSLNSAELIFQDGSKYLPTQATSLIKANGSSKLVTAATSSFNPEKKEVNFEINNENSQLINNSSTFNANNISNVKELYNYGTMTLSGTISTNTPNVIIVNESSLTAKNLSTNSTMTIINTCKLEVTDKATLANKATVNIADEKIFKSKILVLGADVTINLGSHAILDVTNELQFQNSRVKINGPETGSKALLRLEKFTVDKDTEPSFAGYLQIESSNYTANVAPKTYNLPTDSKYVDFVRKGESTVEIASTDCNGGGNVPASKDPSNVTYPIDVTLGTTYTYAFEDNYPSIGDYDMNDFVLDLNLGYTMSATNKVSKIKIQTKVRAVGASKRLAAGIQLDGILKANVKSVTNTNTTFSGGVFSLNNGLEDSQEYAVIPLTDNAHALFGKDVTETINTNVAEAYLPAKDISIEVSFNEPIDISAISLIDMLNVFIINGGYSTSNRTEVHLRGYNPSKKAVDISTGKNYSTSNFVYGIRVPKSIKYPTEWTRIIDAYPLFKTWVSSNGQSDPDWYNTNDANKVYSLER